MLEKVGCQVVHVRTVADLDSVQALVIPGGESSVMDKLCRIFGLRDILREKIKAGLPVFGTCAGLIMLADEISDTAPGQETLGGLDVVVQRNAFGSQLDSFECLLDVPALNMPDSKAVFIRAPIITKAGKNATVLAEHNGKIVAARQGNLLGISFHPEMTDDTRWHEYFVREIVSPALG
ncbi:MAG: pyridoxal 5'-phosphate synthase glutaminase subunit PdxT [Microbacteriaceae bacterium]|nr:pyridoxal 5'-phosphate synthase glutaminase subunit PdxT [Microbacteriaceae bacterium]